MNSTPKTNKPSFLKICAWNANGITNKIPELREFLARLKIDIALINETHLKPSLRANVANYRCYRSDRLTGAAGGTPIYIKNNIPHHILPTPDSMELEVSVINI